MSYATIVKKVFIILFVLSLSGNGYAKDLTGKNASIALDEISESNLYIEKIFVMYSMEFKKEHPREAYENLIYDDSGLCPMCGKEK